MSELTVAGERCCANCGTAMVGEYCHHCGQSEHSVLKPLHGMLEDTMDIVFHVDHRVLHTLPPLLFKPGFLTLEYFSGRRVRYVAPFRLMFVICLLAFFFCHIVVDESAAKVSATSQTQAQEQSAEAKLPASGQVHADFGDASSPEQVHEQLAKSIRAMQLTRPFLSGTNADTLDAAERDFYAAANQRLHELGSAPISAASIPTTASAPARSGRASRGSSLSQDDKGSGHNGLPTDIAFNWLPSFANARLNRATARMNANMADLRQGGTTAKAATGRIIAGVFSALPPCLFVMVPLFAALLKLFYVFKRRLYMEHLIVALHSHAFLFLILLLLVWLTMLSGWIAPHAHWIVHPSKWLAWLLALWIPMYLAIMQKRVYRQGWAITLVKFWFIGWCYFWLLLIALLVAVMLGIAH